MFGNWKEHINNTVATFMVFIVSTVVDAVYILIGLGVNIGVDKFVDYIRPTGLTYWMFIVTQALLATLTLYTIGLYVYSDMRIIYLRSKNLISSIEKDVEEEVP